MPKTPTGAKRPADVIGNAVHVMRIATGEVDDAPEVTAKAKNAAAIELGRMGGQARAKNLSRKKRTAIAANAAKVRWSRKRQVGRGRLK